MPNVIGVRSSATTITRSAAWPTARATSCPATRSQRRGAAAVRRRSGRAQQGRRQPDRHDRLGRRDAAQRRRRRDLSESGNNTIGGTAAGAGNVIAGNAGAGVELENADGNTVFGNWIGTDATGVLDLGNGGSGVEIDGGTNQIGDTGSAAANTIAHNGADGVTVDSGTGNAVLRNSIDDNNGLAIDLADDGPTSNDADDLDPGANDLQNGPELDSAWPPNVGWSLDSVPNTTYRLEFYANDTCSVAHITEAQTFLGSHERHDRRQRQRRRRLVADHAPGRRGPVRVHDRHTAHAVCAAGVPADVHAAVRARPPRSPPARRSPRTLTPARLIRPARAARSGRARTPPARAPGGTGAARPGRRTPSRGPAGPGRR